MSLKDLFSNKDKSNSVTPELLANNALELQRGRSPLLAELGKKNQKFTPILDFSKPENFARYGSAKDYYTYSISRVYNEYPYDGSLQERLEWENHSTYLDDYIFDNQYPRQNGFIYISPKGWGTRASVSPFGDVGLPTDTDYILIKGGPNNDPDYKVTDALSKANIYDTARDRGSSLKLDLSTGSTVEFWLKIPALVATNLTEGELIFDLWNGVTSSRGDYGRLSIWLNNHTSASFSGSAFAVECASGALGSETGFTIGGSGVYSSPAIFPTVPDSSIADNKWHHYAFALENSGTAIQATMYRDGAFVSSIKRASHAIGEISSEQTGAMLATVGAGVTWPNFAYPGEVNTATYTPGRGCAKFSGSIDEFRYWKTARTEKQIKDNWFVPVVGGSNNEALDVDFDKDNVSLGVYYKFNEGITGDATTDAKVLDYSGRISNGAWTISTGMTGSIYRSTNSAMVVSGKASREFKDPVVYSSHPDVAALKSALELTGTLYDTNNTSMLFNRFPTWIQEEDVTKGDSILKNLTQIMSSYLDTLNLQIQSLPDLRIPEYVSGSLKPSEFSYYSLLSKGFLIPTTFVDEEIAARLLSKTEDLKFERDIDEIKKLIYSNIENNLETILKSKGTKTAFRNLLRCYGVDTDLININMYADNVVHTVHETGEYITEKKNFINFAAGNTTAVVYNSVASASGPYSGSYQEGEVGGAPELVDSAYPYSVGIQAVFPKAVSDADYNYLSASYRVPLTSSLLGAGDFYQHTKVANSRQTNFRIEARRENQKNRAAKFVLTGSKASVMAALDLSSSYYDDVFDNSIWTFNLSLYPTSSGANFVSGAWVHGTSPATGYQAKFSGVQTRFSEVVNEFEVSGNVSPTDALSFDAANKYFWMGAYNTNITGTNIIPCYAKLSSYNYWLLDRSKGFKRAAVDKRNMGVKRPARSAFWSQCESADSSAVRTAKVIPQVATKLFYYDFEGITGSSATGQFFVYDYASGSTDVGHKSFRLGPNHGGDPDILAKQYPALGYGFEASSTNMIDTVYMPSFRRDPMETVSTEDSVNILADDDRAFNRDYKPVNFILSIEKSPYAVVSREMLHMFSNIANIADLFGRYVDRFRHQYKTMEYLRSLFFLSVKNIIDVEKFLDYYIWIDETLNEALKLLVPLSADYLEGHDVIESHVLERNKYHHPYPTIDLQPRDLEATTTAINELLYPWKFGHAPVSPDQDTNQDQSCLWWKDRAERTSVLASGDGNVDLDKAKIRKVIVTETTGTVDTFYDSSSAVPTAYQGSTYVLRHLSRPYKVSGKPSARDKNLGDSIPLPNKKYRFLDAFYASHPSSGLSEYFAFIAAYPNQWLDGGVASNIKDCDDTEIPPELKKTKIAFMIETDTNIVASDNIGAFPVDGMNYAPFNLYSSSYSDGGYLPQVRGGGRLNYNAELNDWHKDLYGDLQQNPMQGPFTEQNVGGLKYRHVYANSGRPILSKLVKSDGGNADNRVEGYKVGFGGTTRLGILPSRGPVGPLTLGNLYTTTGEGRYYRDLVAKSPVNIRNIETPIFTSSAGVPTSGTVLGNYAHRYEVVSTAGRDVQKPFFRKGTNSQNLGSPSTALGLVSTKPIPEITINVPVGDPVIGPLSNITDRLSQGMPSIAAGAGVTRTLLDRTYLTGTIKNQTVIGERFSAPGGYEVLSRGFLDPETETYSAYNAMPWRNATVRRALDGEERSFSAQFGFRGRKHLTGNIATTIDGISVSGGYWTASSDLAQAGAVGAYTNLFGTGSGMASLHKTQRNPRYLLKYKGSNEVGAIVMTASVYDNAFVQHSIPQSTRQYAWITASLFKHALGVSAPFGFATGSDQITFLSESEVKSFRISAASRWFGGDDASIIARGYDPVIPQPFNNLNYSIAEPVSSSQNTLGFPSMVVTYVLSTADKINYVNSDINYALAGAANSINRPDWHLVGEDRVLNSIILKRQGPYGWPSWKQIRGGQHPVARHHRLHNTMSINYSYDVALGVNTALLYNVVEPPLSIKYKDTFVRAVNQTVDYDSQIPYSCLYTYFDDTKLDNYLGIQVDTGGSNLETALMFYTAMNTPVPLNKVDYREVVYPRGENTFLGRTRGRQNNIIDYWDKDRADRTVASSQNSQDVTVQNKSIWVLDARQDFATGDAFTKQLGSRPTGGFGELQNPGVIYHTSLYSAMLSVVTASALYNRPVPEKQGNGIIVYGGDTKWQAGKQAGKPSDGPFYETYDQYAEELRAVGKEYSIIPEFRISEHMDYYIRDKNGNFLADFSTGDSVQLSLTGSATETSLTGGFYRKYATSDFLKFFQKTDELLEGKADRTKISLSCKALMKFLPYNGFYPAQRTVELASLFSQSYGEFVEVSGTQGSFRTILSPFFAPGILHNTIKSGLAVDFPVRTSGYLTQTNVTGAGPRGGGGDSGSPRLSGSSVFDYRVPFEALVEPENYLLGRTLYDAEPGLSASLTSSVIFKGAGDPRYKMAMHNFLAETGDFFLKQGKLTSFISSADNEGSARGAGLFNVEPISTTDSTPKAYMMRVLMSHSEYRSQEILTQKQSDDVLFFLKNKSFSWNPPTIQMYSRQDGSETNTFLGSAINYFYGSSFGPACATYQATGFAAQSKYTASYAPFTPPYYNGLSFVDLSFNPKRLGYHNVDDILEKVTIIKDVRYVDDLAGNADKTSTAYLHRMRLTASVNLRQVSEIPIPEFDAEGNAVSLSKQNSAKKWVIQTKFETPVLDFANVDVELPLSGSGSIAKGMWHQYGAIPGGQNGVFFQLQDPVTKDGTNAIDTSTTGSLADLVGFPKTPVKIGQLNDAKTIREAIVAVPYLPDPNGNMEFFKLDARDVGDAKEMPDNAKAMNTVQEMVQKMKRYVFPPRFDFITNSVSAIQPFAMYIFEFEHTLDQNDVKDIWQNLPPSSLLKIPEPKNTQATISHALLAQELLDGDVDSKVEWLVFKVKQRAKTNYFELTADSKDDVKYRFKFDQGKPDGTSGEVPPYSYNWPYDFFSMVELAQIETTVEYRPPSEGEPLDLDQVELETELDAAQQDLTASPQGGSPELNLGPPGGPGGLF